MSAREPTRDLGRPLEGPRRRQPPRLEPGAERLALQKLADQEGGALVLPHVVERHHVRVAQPRGSPRFLLKAAPPLGVGADRLADQLQRHVPAETSVARPPHLAHAAGAERAEDFVMAQATPG